MTARDWLLENGYEDIASMIDEIIAERERNGSKERRNWWDVLAGGKDGKPRIIAGHTFPVLKAAQIRKGMPVTANAVQRNPNESIPPIQPMGRWAKE